MYVGALTLLLCALVGLVVVTSIWSYRRVRGEVEQELEQRLLSIGQAIAQGIGSSSFSSLAGADSPGRLGIIREDLRRIAESSDLGGIEIIDAERRHVVGTLETTSFGESNPLFVAQPEVGVALAGIPAATPLYEVPGLPGVFFKTGFVPIEDGDGNVTGIVAIEGGSGFFKILPALRRTWWITGLGSVCIAVVLGILLLGVIRALDRYERGLRGTAALATAGQLAAVVAHEIRNPLAALQSRSERVQEELEMGADPERLARLLDAIPFEVRRLDRILSNYLSIARVTEGTGGCAIAPVVEETCDLVAKDLSRSSIETVVVIQSRDLRVRLDSGPLRQALLNLLLNAREAMGERGGEVRVLVRAEGPWVRLEVGDQGPGIPQKLRKKIFEPFFTTRVAGSGLGLAVVDSVVRSCGGRVEVQSEPGRGSTFVLLLPRDEKGEADGAARGAVSDSARRG
jgi:signal transduction histidine kinase